MDVRFKEKNHKIPHFHVDDKQDENDACFALSDCKLIRDDVSSKRLRHIEYWFHKKCGYKMQYYSGRNPNE